MSASNISKDWTSTAWHWRWRHYNLPERHKPFTQQHSHIWVFMKLLYMCNYKALPFYTITSFCVKYFVYPLFSERLVKLLNHGCLSDQLNQLKTKRKIIQKLEQVTVLTSICCTVRSRNVRSLRTGMTDFGPWQPMEVPRPPLSFTTTSLSNIMWIWSVDGCCSVL